ncbi:hypothetical protein AGMMS49975_00760 [Clostridia bacterium]|nr:hypothetical protein AGMMS49975_00760 [Clostridia bacterium]
MRTHLTEQDILGLTNNQKREDFLKIYEDWKVWDTSEVLGLTVYLIILPNGDMITAAKYSAQPKYYPTVRLNYLQKGCGFTLDCGYT